MKLLFVDTETSGLDYYRHEIWEVGAILRDTKKEDQEDQEFHWYLPISLPKADLIALNIGGYFDRHPYSPLNDSTGLDVTPIYKFAREFWQLSHGCHIVGAVPDFDTRFLSKLLKANDQLPSWNYHLICVENLVAGKLGIEPPWKSDDLSDKIGVSRDKYEKHTALGDCRWARDLYDRVMSDQPQEPAEPSQG